MVTVPGVTPVTIPVTGSTAATPVEELTQVPPTVPSERGVVKPVHTVKTPEIGSGSGVTDIVVETLHSPTV